MAILLFSGLDGDPDVCMIGIASRSKSNEPIGFLFSPGYRTTLLSLLFPNAFRLYTARHRSELVFV